MTSLKSMLSIVFFRYISFIIFMYLFYWSQSIHLIDFNYCSVQCHPFQQSLFPNRSQKIKVGGLFEIWKCWINTGVENGDKRHWVRQFRNLDFLFHRRVFHLNNVHQPIGVYHGGTFWTIALPFRWFTTWTKCCVV